MPFVKTLIRIFVDHQSDNRFQLSHLSHHLLKAVLSLVVENALFCSIGPRAELTLLDVDFIIRLSHLQIFQTTCKIANCIFLFAISLLKAKNPNRTVKWATLNQSHHYPLLELELCERENTIRDGDSTVFTAASTVYTVYIVYNTSTANTIFTV